MAKAHWHSEGWGGQREGAGRPKRTEVRNKAVSISFEPYTLDQISLAADRQRVSRSALINEILMAWIRENM